MASLIKETDKTNIIGTNAVIGERGEIAGIHCKIADIKKYTFAGRAN